PGSSPPVAEPRQRWRLVFARPVASALSHRELADAWTAALQASTLPLPRTAGRPRPVLAFAAPLLSGIPARRELADLWLAQQQPIADVRQALVASMPEELRLVDLHDVWLGAPALAADLVGAEYRIDLAGEKTAGSELAAAARRLLEAASLPRTRARGSGTVAYDLRPLLDDVCVEAGPPPALRVRTRYHPERGAGRPEEVVAALGDALGRPLTAAATRRERLILRTDDAASHV
ncbi:MAG TPA: TIGR03936 family radical SAM-associated protein, partial [Vitreimonas sp.]|nr:TIGR03936 family radical SAM-associated protein [Vitreimonas sp.]